MKFDLLYLFFHPQWFPSHLAIGKLISKYYHHTFKNNTNNGFYNTIPGQMVGEYSEKNYAVVKIFVKK